LSASRFAEAAMSCDSWPTLVRLTPGRLLHPCEYTQPGTGPLAAGVRAMRRRLPESLYASSWLSSNPMAPGCGASADSPPLVPACARPAFLALVAGRRHTAYFAHHLLVFLSCASSLPRVGSGDAVFTGRDLRKVSAQGLQRAPILHGLKLSRVQLEVSSIFERTGRHVLEVCHNGVHETICKAHHLSRERFGHLTR